MKILVDEETRVTHSRLTFVRLLGLQLRLSELWRLAAGGHQEALVQMAVGAINGDPITRGAPDAHLRSMGHAMPTTLMTKCNLSSIAGALQISAPGSSPR